MKRILLPLLLLLTSCSTLFPERGTPESKMAVLRMTNDYLTSVLTAKIQKLGDFVLWGSYLEDRKITKEEVLSEIEQAKKLFPLAEHPLSNLQPTAIEIRNDDAEVKLKKGGVATAPEISIRLLWGAGGWIVVGDNLFGKDGVVTAAISTSGR